MHARTATHDIGYKSNRQTRRGDILAIGENGTERGQRKESRRPIDYAFDQQTGKKPDERVAHRLPNEEECNNNKQNDGRLKSAPVDGRSVYTRGLIQYIYSIYLYYIFIK